MIIKLSSILSWILLATHNLTFSIGSSCREGLQIHSNCLQNENNINSERSNYETKIEATSESPAIVSNDISDDIGPQKVASDIAEGKSKLFEGHDDSDGDDDEENSNCSSGITTDELDDFTDDDDDDDDYDVQSYSEKEQNAIGELKSIWKCFVSKPLSVLELQQIANQSSTLHNGVTHNNDHFVSTDINENYFAKDSGLSQLYKQILFQFLDPFGTVSKSQWIDRDVVVSLKGLAILAHHPELAKHTNSLTRIPRGVRLSCPQGSLSIQRAVARALGHSVGAQLVVLDKQCLEGVRRQALARSIPRHLLSRGNLIAALLELAEDDDSHPFIIVLGEKETNGSSGASAASWILSSPAANEAIMDELRRQSSKVLFLMTTSDSRPLEGSQTAYGQPSQASSDRTTGESSMGGIPHNIPGSFPPFPPGMMQGKAFHVVMRNGTATMVPMPPGSSPFSMPDGMPLPPDAIMQKIIADQHRQMQGMDRLSSSGNNNAEKDLPGSISPGFPSDMSEEDIQEILKDPEHQAMMKEVLEKILAMVQQNMPQGQPLDPRNLNGAKVEVNVHLIPMTMNAAGQTGSPPGGSPFSGPGTNAAGFPGFIFRGMGMRNKKDSGGSSTTSSSGIDSSNERNNDSGKPSVSISPSSPLGGSKTSRKSTTTTSNGPVSLQSLLETIELNKPTDLVLKEKWEKLVSFETSRRVYRINRRLLLEECEKAELQLAGGTRKMISGEDMSSLLGRYVLSRDEVRRALSMAVRLQLGRSGKPVARVMQDQVSLGVDHIHELQEIVGHEEESDAIDKELRMKFELSIWALEYALCKVMKTGHVTQSVSLSRIGKPRSLTRDEVANLATDKHEKALVSNIILPQDIGVSYSMIGGLSHVKELLQQCVTYPLKYPGLYREGIAAEAVKGVLLFGPPGTGKTMLAKAVATEGGATFLAVDASVIENKWLGESEKNAKAVFSLARRLAPCVVYLDEVDSVLSSRERGDDSSHGTLTSVKTTLMQEWDGLRTTRDRVVVIASTNRPFDLDEAVLRRLPRRILVDLPDTATRRDILSVSLANNRISANVSLPKLAELLEGYSGSDIKEVCREAVVRVSHERAAMLESGLTQDLDKPLRPVNETDFRIAMQKLKASVDESGRELQRVFEWNEKYGEMKRNSKKKGINLPMYI